MDFRQEAAEASAQIIKKHHLTPWHDIGESLCFPVPGHGHFIQYILELMCICVSAACCFWCPISFVFYGKKLISYEFAIFSLVVCLFILLFIRKIEAVFLKVYLKFNNNNIIAEFSDLPSRFVGLEESATVRKIKITSEDYGICFMDRIAHRILFEGGIYRYIIHAKDIISIKPVSGYALGGAILHCKIAGHEIGIALTMSGHGPLLTLIETFIPFFGARYFSALLIATFFDKKAISYEKETIDGEEQAKFTHIWLGDQPRHTKYPQAD